MSQRSLADDILDMENLNSISGSSVSSSSGASSGASSYQHDSTEGTDPKKLKGSVEANMLAQLMRDNIVAALQKRLPKAVGERINQEQMFLQNRFRDYLARVVTPKLITLRNERVQASSSCSRIGSIEALSQNKEGILPFHINIKQFVEQCAGIENCNEAPLTPTSESNAIKLMMTTTEWELKQQGYPEDAIYAIKFRLLELQRQFFTYLQETDAPYRLFRMQEAPV